MVEMSAVEVAHGVADLCRNFHHLADEFFDTSVSQVGHLFQRFIEFLYIGCMVLAVVELHGLRVDVRFEGGVVVGKGRQLMSHGASLGNDDVDLRSVVWMMRE